MRVYEPSFGASFDVPANGVSKEQAVCGRNAGYYAISAPRISVCCSNYTKGEIADYKTNRIEKKHLNNLYKNIYLMDKINMNHNDLDIGHVFYADDGGVEFDCFRFASFFSKKPWQNYSLPDFIMPTNLINYENASLGVYLNQIPSQGEKDDLIRDYLIAGSKFHAKRAEIIENSLAAGKKGITPEMLEYEELQAFVNRNPDDDIVRLRQKRLDFLRLQSEGDIFSALKSAMDYSSCAKNFKEKSPDEDMKKYYDFERRFGEYFADKYTHCIENNINS